MPPGHPIILLKSNLFSMAAVSVKRSILHADFRCFTTHAQLCCQYSQSSPGYQSEFGCVSDTRRNGKFDLNTDTCGNGNFFLADFKNIWIQKYYVLFIPFKRCLRQRQGHKIKSFCYHFFNCRVMKSYQKNDVNLLRSVTHSFF